MEISKITEFIMSLNSQNQSDVKESKSINHSNNISTIKKIPSEMPEYYEKDLNLPETLHEYLEDNKLKLYTHQSQVLENIRNSNNVLLTTSTASGKTLAFNLPVFETLINDKDATALYIYPTKALTNDQIHNLKKMDRDLNLGINPGVYDGDTPQWARKNIRENSRIVLTNPYELHQILQYHSKWKNFWKNLKYIVIDEAHSYRGIFGSNVAYLIRRMKRIYEYYNSNPLYILASATLANSKEFSKNLIGEEFTIIDSDGSRKNRRFFILYNILNEDIQDDSYSSAIISLFKKHFYNDLKTIGFVKSRKMAELYTLWVKESLKTIEDKNKISVYRAGIAVQKRKEIENAFKTGDLKAVISTNALEVGIDVGSLDSVIMCGYPGTLMSFWQQAGRAGRAGNDSSITLIANEYPLDQYVVTHPEILFNKSTENAVINLENPYIIMGHILCAASEIPLKTEEINKYFMEGLDEFIEYLSEAELLQKTAKGWVYKNTVSASEIVSLNSIFSNDFMIIDENGKYIESLDKERAFGEAHTGAIYISNSEQYYIRKLNLNTKEANAIKTNVDYYTKASASISVDIVEELAKKDYGCFSVHYGEVNVIKSYYMYETLKYGTKINMKPLDLPPLSFQTTAIWYSFKPEFFRELSSFPLVEIIEGLHGVEHAMINIFPIHILCDTKDIGGCSIANESLEECQFFIYDGFEGGIGLAEKAFKIPEKIAKTAYELVRDCKCDNVSGCPSCIYSPSCGSGNNNLNKKYSKEILEKINGIFNKMNE
ncbi:DEAD/DEAH box helicase domain-containing protein [Methanococcus voltae PS]|uniref:DEAD/DEAH box helicase domain-containing protein n=1 Tax=Methanococcus voltae PS TaxID=523842 RepID=A0ABT2EVS9_METVO|nr:DEAD/DEAH box helicase [Methanococcus voltae]MCS3921960.1 DEAD/DEAH box helicase domain-containing protein [Methanococcus voltae PS]